MLKKHRVFRLLLGVFMLVAITVLASFYRSVYVLPISDKAFQFDLLQKQTFTRLTDDLVQRGIIKSPFYWMFLARIRGADRRVKAGTYHIEANTTLSQLLDDLVEGKVFHYHFTVYEGWNLKKIIDAMREHPQIVITLDTPEEIRTHLKLMQSSAEGWIYPETYSFQKDTSNAKLFEIAHDLMQKKLSDLWAGRNADLPLKSPYDALILASIVEKETANDEEYRRIAGVFLSRLEKGMRLQTDPSVIYGLGEKFDGNLRKSDLSADTPYNTYIHRGLPPTPIAMPSEKSIAAVLDPEIRGDLYFVAKGGGKHHFSKTYAEHQEAVRRYQLKK